MTVDDLAAKLGKNRATIYRYECDAIEMPASLLKPLADALDTTPGDLMDWGTLLADLTATDETVRELLPYIGLGVSVRGGNKKYVLFKAPAHGGKLEEELRNLLLSIYQLNHENQAAKMRTIRTLAELVSTLDSRAQNSLVSYAEFLDTQRQKRQGISAIHPYQRE